jgi:hypothetical protein
MSTSGGSSAQEDAQQQMIDRASSDPTFRDQLLRDPREAIQEEIGIPLPANITIRVVEEQPGEVILVLPAQSMAPGTTLSDADLEAAAGGDSGMPGCGGNWG